MSEQNGFTEKRKHGRYAGNINIEFHIRNKDNPEILSEKQVATAKNISEEGVCFVCEQLFERDTFLVMDILFPMEPEPLHIEGQVIWSNPLPDETPPLYETGVQLFYNQQRWNIS